MSREISRVQCGYFPTQDRIVAALSKLIQPAAAGPVSVLDACCGTGEAIARLKANWNAAHVRTLGIELDKDRAAAAEKNLDEALWSAIEDAHPSAGVSLLFFNPPYDEVRGSGRLEAQLLDVVKEWTRKDGLLVLIVPASVLQEEYGDLPYLLTQWYETLATYDYPLPERKDFGQCVYIGQRREQQLRSYDAPAFPKMPWPELPLDAPKPLFTAPKSANVTLRRVEVPDAVLLDSLSRSPLKHALLQDALAPEPPLARPPLPLRSGHVALLLAGGMCDSVIEDKEHGKFMVKGSLNVSNRKMRTEDKLDSDGTKIAEVDVYRTRYELNVKALKADGTVEAYTSEPEPELIPVDGGEEEDEDA